MKKKGVYLISVLKFDSEEECLERLKESMFQNGGNKVFPGFKGFAMENEEVLAAWNSINSKEKMKKMVLSQNNFIIDNNKDTKKSLKKLKRIKEK